MVMGSSICTTCGELWTFDLKPRRTECFKCHVRGINLGFTHGKSDFHGPTVRERQRQHEAEMTAKGIDFAPATRWV